MPATPYAKLLISVNGGGPVSGGVDVPSAATIQLSAESTVGWKQQRWEIYDYPEGFATPASWTLAADGTIFTTDPVPALITLPANTELWGPWGFRLVIDEAVVDDDTQIEGLIDEATAIHMASPGGLRKPMAFEDTQFCTPTTLHKKWVRTLQRVLDAIEDGGVGGGGPEGVTSPEAHDATGDGVADDNAEIEDVGTDHAAADADAAVLELGARTYLVTGLDPWPMGLSIFGQGPRSILKTTTNAPIIKMADTDAGDRAKHTVFRDFKLLGNSTGAGQNGIEVGYAGSDGTSQLRIEGVIAQDMGGSTGRGFSWAYGDEIIGAQLIGCEAKNCGDGYYAGHAGTLTGCKASECDRGLVIAAGNVNCTGGQLIENTIGVEVLGGGNDAHSIVSATHINHCTKAVKVGSITNAMTFADCHIYDGAIEINGDGANQGVVHFDGGEFDVTTITATDGGVRFTNAVFDTGYASGGVVTTTGGSGLGWVEFVNCTGRTGTLPSWIRDRVLVPYTFASDANQDLTWQQSVAKTIRVLSGVTTATRTLTNKWGSGDGRVQRIVNRNAQSVSFKWAAGGAVTIPTGTWALIAGNGSAAIVLEAGSLIADGTAGIDPTTIDFDGLWLPNYGGAPWAASASAGSSAGRDLITNGVDPDVGAAVNGYTGADFESGSPDELRITATTAENFVTTTAYTIPMLIKPESAAADTTVYNNPGLFTETGGNLGVVYSDAGVSVYHASTLVAQAAVPTGSWAHVVVRFGLVAGELDIFVNGVLVDHNTGVAATGSVTGAALFVGANYAGTVNYDGQIMELGTSQTAHSDVTVAGLYEFAKAKYPAMSLP